MGFITGGPTEAIVVSGCFHSKPLIVVCFRIFISFMMDRIDICFNIFNQVGGWAFVCPCVQKVQRLPLALMTLVVSTPRIYTVHGVPLSVTGIAQVSVLKTYLQRLDKPMNVYSTKVKDISKNDLTAIKEWGRV